MLAGVIGLIDDIKGIGAVCKVVLFMVPAIPIIVSGAYVPHPYVPMVGNLRLTIVYPILILILSTVLANGFNMSDTQNGTVLIVFLTLCTALGIGILLQGPRPMPIFLPLYLMALASTLTYLPFNTYPAVIFNGNCGSHLLGVLAAILVITSRREFLALMVLTPLFLNGFSIIASKGIRSKENVPRPTILTKDYVIRANYSDETPITLVQLLTLKVGLKEKELIITYLALYLVVMVISLILYFMLNML